MRTRFSLACLTSISVALCTSLIGCTDEPSTNRQATAVQAKVEEAFTLSSDEIDLLAECQGHEEFFATGVDPDDELGLLFVDAYRQAATHVPMGQRQQYEKKMKGVAENLAATNRDLDQSTDVAERRVYRSKLLGAEAQKLWDRCDSLMITRFPKIDGNMVAKARALGVKN